MIINLVLLASLFYYIAKGISPDYVTGRTVYPLLIIGAICLFTLNILKERRGSVPNQIFWLSLAAISTLIVLYVPASIYHDTRRFETSMSQYFGVLVSVMFFYPLLFFLRFDPLKSVKLFIFVLSIDAIAEFILLNFFGLTKYMVHYDRAGLREIEYVLESGFTSRAVGLLGNRSMTASFMVALFWLYLAFKNSNTWRLIPLLFSGFVACLSGVGFVALLVSAVFYKRSRTLFLVLLVIALYVAAAVAGTLFTERFDFYFHKISYDYLYLTLNYKFSILSGFLDQLYAYPTLVFFGAPSSFGWGDSDLSILKVLTDFGIGPLVLYGCLIYILVNNLRASGMSRNSLHLIKLSMLALVVGSFHYAVIFSVPVQILLGLLVAYSIHARNGRHVPADRTRDKKTPVFAAT